VTKKDLAKAIAERLKVNQLLALEIVQMTFDGITDALVNEGRIELRNFGVFEVKARQARSARNPRTGEKVMVPQRFVVTFKPGREMEQRVAQMKALPHRPPGGESDDEPADDEPAASDAGPPAGGAEPGRQVSARREH
jgi:nucleoid DNA-binding protein